jgi:hypothetical protein
MLTPAWARHFLLTRLNCTTMHIVLGVYHLSSFGSFSSWHAFCGNQRQELFFEKEREIFVVTQMYGFLNSKTGCTHNSYEMLCTCVRVWECMSVYSIFYSMRCDCCILDIWWLDLHLLTWSSMEQNHCLCLHGGIDTGREHVPHRSPCGVDFCDWTRIQGLKWCAKCVQEVVVMFWG